MKEKGRYKTLWKLEFLQFPREGLFCRCVVERKLNENCDFNNELI